MADNVDHDSRTLDGKGTFHVMGSIASVTPLNRNIAKSMLTENPIVPRNVVKSDEIITAAKVEIHYFSTKNKTRTKNVFELPKTQLYTHERHSDIWYTVEQRMASKTRTTNVERFYANGTQKRKVPRKMRGCTIANH